MVILCGPHIQGAQGISCGRHLANHEVEVILFLPNFVKMQESVTSEVQLYSRTSSKQVSSVKGRAHQQVMDRSMLQLCGLICVQSGGGEREHDSGSGQRCPLVEQQHSRQTIKIKEDNIKEQLLQNIFLLKYFSIYRKVQAHSKLIFSSLR